MKWKNCLSIIAKQILILFLTVVLIFLVPILTVIGILIYLYRSCVFHYAKAFKPQLGSMVTTRNALLATDEFYSKPKSILVIPLVIQGTLVIGEIRDKFDSRVLSAKAPSGKLSYPELKQCIESWMGYLFWKWDAAFDLANHMKLYDGTSKYPIVDESAINSICMELLKKPFVKGRSPWEAILVPNYRPNRANEADQASTLLIYRMSHAMADGFSIINLLAPSVAKMENQLAIPKAVRRSIWRKVLNTLAFPFVAPYELVASSVDATDRNECHIPESTLSDTVLVAFSDRIPMQYLKTIKDGYNATFTGLMLAAFTGAARTFMIENKFKIPENIHCLLPFPMPRHPDKLRNNMSSCMIAMPVGIEDPEERLKKIDSNLRSMRKSTVPITVYYLLIPLLGGLPACIAKNFFLQSQATAIASNFPGPNSETRYDGHLIKDVRFTCGLLPGNIGFGFNLVSYNGYVRIQAAFNEAIPAINLPVTYLVDKVVYELQILMNKQFV